MKIIILNDTLYEAHHRFEVVIGNIKKFAKELYRDLDTCLERVKRQGNG
jgi:hypothetical protein